MKTNLKKIRECKMRLSVVVDAKQVENCYQEILKSLQGEATLAGFRHGKAPLDLVEKKFTKEVREEVLKSLIPEAYHQAVLKHELAPVSLPSISPAAMERGRELTFEAEFETEPEFSLKNYKGLKIKKVPVEVRPEDFEKGLTALLESKAELVPLQEKKLPSLDDAFAKKFGKETVEELKA